MRVAAVRQLRPPTHLLGQRFGRLTVQSLESVALPKSGKRHYKATCLCDCGNVKGVFTTSLIRGTTISCRCDRTRYAKMVGVGHTSFKGFQEIRLSLWNKYRLRAEERGLAFEISLESAWAVYEAQSRRCALTGEPLSFGVGYKASQTTASLDRIDNNLGYVDGNVQWVHKTINIMRNALTVDEFRAWCLKVVLHGGTT